MSNLFLFNSIDTIVRFNCLLGLAFMITLMFGLYSMVKIILSDMKYYRDHGNMTSRKVGMIGLILGIIALVIFPVVVIFLWIFSRVFFYIKNRIE